MSAPASASAAGDEGSAANDGVDHNNNDDEEDDGKWTKVNSFSSDKDKGKNDAAMGEKVVSLQRGGVIKRRKSATPTLSSYARPGSSGGGPGMVMPVGDDDAVLVPPRPDTAPLPNDGVISSRLLSLARKEDADVVRGRARGDSNTFTLVIHRRTDYDADVVLNPDYFPDYSVGDVIELHHPDRADASHKLLLRITSLAPVKGNLQISVLNRIADLPSFNLQSFQPVVVNKVDPLERGIDYVEFTFKDQYVSQGDFWRMKETLVNTIVHQGKSVSHLGVWAKIHEILLCNTGEQAPCGLVLPTTKFIFRSLSARIFWLVQMSKEMWDFAEDGMLHYERFVNVFVKEICAKWKSDQSRHSLSILFFTRTFFNGTPSYEQLFKKPILQEQTTPTGGSPNAHAMRRSRVSSDHLEEVGCKNISKLDAVKNVIRFSPDGRPCCDINFAACSR